MKNKNKLLILMMFCMGVVNAQSIEQLFKNLPDFIDPLLTYKERNEMVEYAKSNQIDTIRNRLGGNTYFLKYDTLQRSVVVKNSSSSLFEMRIIDNQMNHAFVAVIYTALGPIKSSTISFFDTKWRPISVKFTMPKSADWIDETLLASADGVDQMWVRNSMNLNFVSLKFDENLPVLIADNHSADFLNAEDSKKVEPFVRSQSILYEFRDGAWVRK